jgi:hypothetical protein
MEILLVFVWFRSESNRAFRRIARVNAGSRVDPRLKRLETSSTKIERTAGVGERSAFVRKLRSIGVDPGFTTVAKDGRFDHDFPQVFEIEISTSTGTGSISGVIASSIAALSHAAA